MFYNYLIFNMVTLSLRILLKYCVSLIETFKFGFLGVGTFSWFHLGYTLVFTVVIMLWGMVTFNRVQRSFMDVI